MNDVEGVVLTGVYGVGKTSVVEEMAEMLEQQDIGYAAIDVDWLWWFHNKRLSDQQYRQILFANLKTVISNYLDAGVNRFLLAWSIRSQRELDELRASIPFPFKIVTISAPLELIKERLASDVTSGRHHDMHNTEKWLKEGINPDIHDTEIVNDRPIQEVAIEVLNYLKWEV